MAKALVYVMIFASLAGSLATLVVGIVVQFMFSHPVRKHEQAVLEVAKDVTTQRMRTLQAGAANVEDTRNELNLIGETVTSLADLAKALKDLDPATRCYFVSLVFLVAGITTALLVATIV